jgi:hypothetical protein
MLYNNECVRVDGFSYFHRIDNKYSPPGHTFMEVRNSLSVGHLLQLPRMHSQSDRAFGCISRKSKKTMVVGSSKAWMRLAQESKAAPDNYHTMWMDRGEFRDWKTFLSLKYVRPSGRWTNTDGEVVPLMKVPDTGLASPVVNTLTVDY